MAILLAFIVVPHIAIQISYAYKKQPMPVAFAVFQSTRPAPRPRRKALPRLIHSAPQSRQSNGYCPFAQTKAAPSIFGSGPF